MKRTLWKRLLVGLLVAYVAVTGTISLARYFPEQHAARQKVYWQNQAEQAATPSLTPDAARQWLRDNGFKVWSFGEAQEDYTDTKGQKTQERYFMVAGSMQVNQGGWLHRPAWVDVQFDFKGKSIKHIRTWSRSFPPPYFPRVATLPQ
jgi:hypothetical protein